MILEKKKGTISRVINWFIGDYLKKTEDYLTQTRIRLIFFVLTGTSIVVGVVNLISLIYELYISFFLSLIAIFSFLFSLYILKVKQNVKLSSSIVIIMTYLILSSSLLFENKIISVFYILYLFASCVFTFFILGKRWGVYYTIAISVVIALYIHFFMYDNFQTDGAFDTAKLWIVYAVVLIALSITIFILMTFLNVRDTIQLKFEDKNNELLQANLIAEHALKVQELFIANTSHEIRTPMNAIIGYSELMKKEDLTTTQMEYMEIIRTASDNLLFIINDILEYSKISAGNIVIDHSPITIDNTLKNVISLLKFQANSKNIELELNISQSVPPFIFGDKKRLNQVLINLIGNAIKFTKSGSVELNVNCTILDEDICEIYFEVKDTGIGIPADKIESIFEKFVQLDSTITREYGGTGLGLTISSELVKLLGGKLFVESIVNKGSKFYFTLRTNYRADASQSTNEIELFEIEGVEGIRILLVDDNYINRKLAVDSIKKWNSKIQVDTAIDGFDALDSLSKERYDIILMDLHMPKLDGYETTQHIRHVLKSDIKIIALTASVLTHGKVKCLANGMNDFILKPFEIDHLMKVIAKQLSLKITKVKSTNLTNEFERFSDSELLKRVADRQSIRYLLTDMTMEVDAAIINLKTALIEKNWTNVFDFAHSIKNNAIYFGSGTFTKELEIIEKKADVNCEDYKHEIDLNFVLANWDLIKSDIITYIQNN